jgi:hypothetical protein
LDNDENKGIEKKLKTTLIIPETIREEIKKSGMSIEDYFAMLYDVYKRYSIADWKEGCYWLKTTRIALIKTDTFNGILTKFDEEAQVNLGRELGKKAQVGLKYNYDIEDDTIESKKTMLSIFSKQIGWGQFIWQNNNILIKLPIFKGHSFIQGYLEGILDLELTPMELNPDLIVFKISQKT